MTMAEENVSIPKIDEEYKQMANAARVQSHETCKDVVDRLWKKLMALGFIPLAARYQIVSDLPMWKEDTILEFLPPEAKNGEARRRGIIAAAKAAEKRKQELEIKAEITYPTLLKKDAVSEIFDAHMKSLDGSVLMYTKQKPRDFVSATPGIPQPLIMESDSDSEKTVSSAPVRSI